MALPVPGSNLVLTNEPGGGLDVDLFATISGSTVSWTVLQTPTGAAAYRWMYFNEGTQAWADWGYSDFGTETYSLLTPEAQSLIADGNHLFAVQFIDGFGALIGTISNAVYYATPDYVALIPNLLSDYVAELSALSLSGAAVNQWNSTGSGPALIPNLTFAVGVTKPTYSASGLGGKACVVFDGSNLMEAALAYTGQEITYIFCGSVDLSTFLSGAFNTGYPRLADLVNNSLGYQDFNSESTGIFLYSSGGSWDSFTHTYPGPSIDISTNADAEKRCILILKQSIDGLIETVAYFPDDTNLSDTAQAYSLPNYLTDTLNLGGNTEPNCGVFKCQQFAVIARAIDATEQADAVAYLKGKWW